MKGAGEVVQIDATLNNKLFSPNKSLEFKIGSFCSLCYQLKAGNSEVLAVGQFTY